MGDYLSDCFCFIAQLNSSRGLIMILAISRCNVQFHLYSSRRRLFRQNPTVEKINVRVNSVRHGPVEMIYQLTRVVVTFQTRWRLPGQKDEALIGFASVWKFGHHRFRRLLIDRERLIPRWRHNFRLDVLCGWWLSWLTWWRLASTDWTILFLKDFVSFFKNYNFFSQYRLFHTKMIFVSFFRTKSALLDTFKSFWFCHIVSLVQKITQYCYKYQTK
jgi:hypothetical protein